MAEAPFLGSFSFSIASRNNFHTKLWDVHTKLWDARFKLWDIRPKV